MKGGKNASSDGVKAEAFTFAIHNRLEQCVLQDDLNYKALIKKKFRGDPRERGRRQQRKKDALIGPLLVGALRHSRPLFEHIPRRRRLFRIFNARALHVGHIARSL